MRVNGRYAGAAIGPRSKLAPLAWEGGREGPIAVPDRAYVVLGDNADVSVDSRCWGFLPQTSVVGRPLMRVLPLGRIGTIGDAPPQASAAPAAP